MKKIMFNDRYGLTEAVLSGRKTMTRRIISCPKTFKGEWVAGFHIYRRQSDGTILEYPCMCDAEERDFDGGQILPKYKVGEIVAIAQSYKNAGLDPQSIIEMPIKGSKMKGVLHCEALYSSGWTNKMFVRADLMPHQIQFNNCKFERLQDISDEDCIKEGIINWNCRGKQYWGFFDNTKNQFSRHTTPREAFAFLIDRVSGKGTWESNPYVFAYDFKLVK